jgi:Tfp pilus assembly protein PilO
MKINLIPEVKREQLKIKNINLWTTNIAVLLGIVFAAVIVIMGAYIGGVAAKIGSTEKQTNDLREELKAYESLENTVISIQEGVREVKYILNNEDKWKNVFEIFEQATPNDIRFRSLNISSELVATAQLEGNDVNSIDRFIKSFESYKRDDKFSFSNVDVSGYTTNEKGLVTFSATFSINQDVLGK